MARKILGELFGIEIMGVDKGKDPILKLLLEDDGNWHEKCAFSSFWLNDLLDVIEATKVHLRTPPREEK